MKNIQNRMLELAENFSAENIFTDKLEQSAVVLTETMELLAEFINGGERIVVLLPANFIDKCFPQRVLLANRKFKILHRESVSEKIISSVPAEILVIKLKENDKNVLEL